MDLLHVLLTVFSVIGVIVLGLLTYINNPKSKISLTFLGICLSFSIWILANYLADRNILSLFWSRIAFTSMTFGLFCFYNFACVFPERKPIKARTKKLVLICTILLLVVEQTELFIPSTFILSGLSTVKTGSLYLLFPVYIVVFFCASIYLLLKNRSKQDLMTKARVNLVLTGIVIVAVVGMITNLLLPSILGNDKFASFGTFSTLIFISFTAYAIIRHSLFDIRFFAVRAAAYLSTFFIITIVIVLPIVIIFEHLLGLRANNEQLALFVFLTVFLIYLLQYIRATFDNFTSRVFFRYYFDFQDVLDKISSALVRTSDVDGLRTETEKILKLALRTDSLRYVLIADKTDDEIHQIKKLILHRSDRASNVVDIDEIKNENALVSQLGLKDDIALVVKLRTTEGSLGYMLLGHKQSGEMYSSRDKKLLNITADEIAISIQNALRFKEIQKFNVTLQQKIDDATLKLRDTNRRLKLLDQTKDDFISMASHQLRTPLTSVKGYLSLVIDGDAGEISDSQRKLLTQAFFSSQRMVFLIADLLNVSRLKTGKFIIERTFVNLADIIEQELAQLVETAKGRDLTLEFKKPEHFPSLNIDETKTRQVIMNFCDNAIYYTPAGGHIIVQLENLEKSIEWKVIDNGIGVPKIDQHHLFSKFYRAKNAQKARPDGTGLGLFMAKKIIVAQGGAIIFNSQEGKGSTFGFTFPKAGITEPTPPGQVIPKMFEEKKGYGLKTK